MRAAERFPELAPFVSAVEKAYQGRLHGIYLFGSRARGDHKADSDYDVAVVSGHASVSYWTDQFRLADMTYDQLLAQDIHIQALPVDEVEWVDEEKDFIRSAKGSAVDLRGVGTWIER